MSVFLSPMGGAGAQFFDNNGNPLTGGKLYTYSAGTTTPAVTYTSSVGNTAHSNPIILDAAGRVPGSSEIWLADDQVYKFVLKDSNDVMLATWDSISGVNDVNASVLAFTGFKGQSGTVQDIGNATGSDWIGFTPLSPSGIAASVQDKLRQYVSVFDFMTEAQIAGVRNGSQPDVTSAIQSAVGSAKNIYFPPGQYKITAPINWGDQWLIGAADNGELSTATNQTMIIADGTFPAFRYYNSNGYNGQGGGIKNFNIYFANGAAPTTDVQRPNAIGVYISGNDGYPAFYSIENITVRGATWACYDASGAWMATYKHINSQHNFAGFYKRYGTTINYENCYHRGGYAGWHIIDCIGVSMDACAFDLVSSIKRPSYFPMFVENSNVVVNGGDFEGNTLEGSSGKLIFANGGNAQVQFNGSRFIFTSIGSPGAGNENYLVFADSGAKVTMTNVDFSTPVRTGTDGAVFYSVAKSNSVVTWKNCNIPQFTGTGASATNYSGQAYSGGTIDFDGTKFYYPWDLLCYQQEKAIKFETLYNPASVPANSRIVESFTVNGAQTGDYTYCVFEWPTYGVIVDSFVTAANEVTVVFYNVTSAPIDLPEATLRLSVVKKFYSQ